MAAMRTRSIWLLHTGPVGKGFRIFELWVSVSSNCSVKGLGSVQQGANGNSIIGLRLLLDVFTLCGSLSGFGEIPKVVDGLHDYELKRVP